MANHSHPSNYFIFLILFLIKNQKDKKALIKAVNAEDHNPPEHDIEDYKA